MRYIQKPSKDEYPAYASMYIDLLPEDGLIMEHLQSNLEATKKLLSSIPEEKLLFRYAPGKWTIKEVLLHISDDERIYTYRALRFARNDATELPGFEQEDFARFSGANDRNLNSLLEEFESVRMATITLFNGLPEESFLRWGMADKKKSTVRGLLYHLTGHELHHINIIKNKYL